MKRCDKHTGIYMCGASLVAQMVKNSPVMQETRVWSLGREDLLEKGMATHSSILAWRVPWTEEPGRLQSMRCKELDMTERLTFHAFGTHLEGRAPIDRALTLTLKLLSRLRLCNPMDCSLPGSSVHGIFQARVLEWVAISFSRRSSRPKDRTWVSRIVGRRFTVWATRALYII